MGKDELNLNIFNMQDKKSLKLVAICLGGLLAVVMGAWMIGTRSSDSFIGSQDNQTGSQVKGAETAEEDGGGMEFLANSAFYEREGELKPVNPVVKPVKGGWVMDEANYGARFKDNIQDKGALEYIEDQGSLRFGLAGMSWTNSEGGKTVINSELRSVEGKLVKNGEELTGRSGDAMNGIIYEDVYKGVDVGVLTLNTLFRKLVKIESLEDLGEIPGGVDFLEISFEVESDIEISDWDGVGEFEVRENIGLGDNSWLRKAKAWDSFVVEEKEVESEDEWREDGNEIAIRSYFKNIDEQIYFIKEIPIEWLKTAEFPIYTDADVTYGTVETFGGVDTRFIRVAELDTNKFVVCALDLAVDQTINCKVATVSGTDMTWGSYSSTGMDAIRGTDTLFDVCKLATDKFVVVQIDDAQLDDGYAIAVTVSGTTIGTWGTAVEIVPSDMEWASCAQLDTDKFVACYDDETDSDTGKCVASTVSGTTITAGTPVAFDGGVTDYYPNIMGTAQLGTDKFITCFKSFDTTNGHCVAATVSGTAITFGTVSQFVAGTLAYVGLTSPDTDKFVVSYRASSNTGESIAGTVSGTTISYGSAVTHESGDVQNNQLASVDATHVVVAYADVGNGSQGTSNYLTINWADSSISASTPEIFESGATGGAIDRGLDTDLIGANKIVVCFQDDADTDVGKCIVGDTPATNAAPTVTSVTDSPDPIGVGSDINFSLDWADADAEEMVKVVICKGSGITTSTLACKDGQWAVSAVFTNRDPENQVNYTTQAADKGSTHNYWGFVCDDSGDATTGCSAGTAGTFTVANQRPDAPATILIEGMEVGNALNLTDTSPEFSALYKDSDDEGDVGEEYCIEVDTQADFAGTDMWISDSASCYSGSAVSSNISEGDRSEEFSYAGSALSAGTTYYWRMWFWDGEERSVTSTAGWFKMASDAAGAGVRLQGLLRFLGKVRLQ